MRIDVKNQQELSKYVDLVDNHVKSNHELKWTRFVQLGSKVVRLLGYSDKFLPHIEKQLTYILKEDANMYDATLVLWEENDAESLSDVFLADQPLPRKRVEKIVTKNNLLHAEVFDKENSNIYPLIRVNPIDGFVHVYNEEKGLYYYGVQDLSTEEFMKEGHIFVQMFNKIVKSDNRGLAHGALVGLEGEGVLFCARGQRGKSTLSVLSMMDGFDYVSDDYLILEKKDGKLYTDPIYSIITLSPRMYDELYDRLEGSRFISNNGRKDKYVINIANYHDQFRSQYPVKFCMFPEIVSDAEPSIVPCPKGRAICQLVQSTVFQVRDSNDQKVIKKLVDMVKDYEFYQINLCQDIQKNTDCLREFMKNYESRDVKSFDEDSMFVDVTFDLAHFLNSETGVIYAMNKFATNIYENLVAGVDKDLVLQELLKIKGMPSSIENDFNSFVKAMLDKNIIKELKINSTNVTLKEDLIKENSFEIVLTEHLAEKTINLVKSYN